MCLRTRFALQCVLVLTLGMSGCARVVPATRSAPPNPAAAGWTDVGVASWYGEPFHGRLTASGEVYDMEGMTAAHRTLPFGTVLRVENLDNGRVTTVRITDRGPFIRGRHLDLSRRAAREIDMIGPGTARVRMTALPVRGSGPTSTASTALGPPPSGSERSSCWLVQVGAFASRGSAEAVERDFETLGHSAEVATAIDGLHRVRVGPLDSRDLAESIARGSEGILVGCPSPA